MTTDNSKRPVIQVAQPFCGEEEWQSLKEVIYSGWLTQGPKTKKFEDLFAQYHQSKHALAASSCTTALHMCLMALGVKPGDEVIVPSFTWVATANVVQFCGATPVFADNDPTTYNIQVKGLKKLRTSKTKAIIPVHLFGSCVDMDALKDELPGLPIVEDAACAVGATYKGKFAGTLGDMGAFSFHPRKVITTGEGGMITTNNDHYADLCNKIRNHGAEISEEQRHHGPRPYLLSEFNVIGNNYRMTDLQASLGVVQMGRFESLLEEREKWAKFYHKELQSIPWIKTPELGDSKNRHGLQAYVCFIDEKKAPHARNKIMEILLEKGISTRPGTHAIHQLGLYKNQFGFKDEQFPGATLCANQTMSLPLHNKMNEEDFYYVVETVKSL